MIETVASFEALDIIAHVTSDGIAILTLITDKGRVTVHMKRPVLESLEHRARRELSRVARPVPVSKDDQ
ncbi:MAG TPA: hypothetical protein VKS78_05075 [Roseiarcus sp.]|nr:hypothetical protein [Roseiarcus sp.]